MKNLIFTLATIFCLFITVNSQTQIWGCAQNGGATGQGTIFSADGNGGNFQNQYSLVNATGAMPVGNCLYANNGKLYGVTYMGGCNDSCVCYMFDPISGTWTNFHDLYCDISHGWDGWGGMIQASDNNLYGLCSQGGANGLGVVYKVDPTTNTYTDIHDLDSTNGINPYGSLVQLSDGKLYGMTRSGGAANYGVIFNFDPSNSTYTVLHSFDGTTGGNPEYGTIIQASDGKLYGMTNGGGVNNVGVIFSFDMSSNTYTKLHDFDGTHGGNPFENLIQATDGKLYGLTYMGGYYNDGVLFSFNITTSTYTDLFEFTGVNTGANPTRSVMQASNGKLYGTAFSGGASNMGVAFSYDINYNAYTKLVDFNATIGSNPDCGFIETPQMTTGIPAITDNAVGVYPNPATSVLNITQSKFTTITITNVLGEEVYNQAINNSTPTAVDVSNWSKGVYLLQLKSETETLVKKVVVE